MPNTERLAENDSNESTFILITSELSGEQIEYIRESVRKIGLSITYENQVQLDKDKIQKVWPGVIEERTQERTYEILSGRDLLLINITGVSAVSKIALLKKVVRRNILERDDGFNRIMHCPDSQGDSMKELEIFFDE